MIQFILSTKKSKMKAMAASKHHFPVTTTFHLWSKSSYQQIRCKYTKHPNITYSTIYDYLHLIDAPECFDITSGFISSGYKDNKKAFHNCLSSSSPPATISALEQVQEILYTTTVDVEESSNDLSFPPTTTDDDLPPQYAALIAAFCQSNTIICDACGSKGHHASKCFKRGIEFLPIEMSNVKLPHIMRNMAQLQTQIHLQIPINHVIPFPLQIIAHRLWPHLKKYLHKVLLHHNRKYQLSV